MRWMPDDERRGCVGAGSLRRGAVPTMVVLAALVMGTAGLAVGASTYRCPIDKVLNEVDPNCVEDVAFWECRDRRKSRDTFLECITRVGKEVITNSGQKVSDQSEWMPQCEKWKGPSDNNCLLFGGKGADESWCVRVDVEKVKQCEGDRQDETRTKCRLVPCPLGKCTRPCAVGMW
jgi:hypothetical protein